MHDPRASTSQPPERGSLPTRTARNVTFHPCSKEDGCTFKTGSQAAPMFIKRPDFNRYRRFRALEFTDPGLEFFLNISCSYKLCSGLQGRGTCGVSSRR